jgi:RND family efflux transporter MFP subunit
MPAPNREEIAKEEIGKTDVTPLQARLWSGLFLLLIFGYPLLQARVDRARADGEAPALATLDRFPRAAAGGWASRDGFFARLFRANAETLAALQAFEDDLEEQSLLRETLIEPVQRFMTGVFARGNETAFLGRDGWLYFHADVEYSLSAPFLDPVQLARRARGGNEFTAPPQPDPRLAILQFHGQLRERGIAAEAQLDEIAARLRAAQASLQLAEAQVARARSSLELRRIELSYTQVRAEWSERAAFGSVAERYQDPGNTVQPNTPVISVVTLDPLKAVIFVTERDYAGLRPGQTATLTTDAAPGRTFEGVVDRVAPVFRENSRQARIELSVPNPDNLLRPGMFVRVRTVLSEQNAPAIIPLTALTRRNGHDVVFVLDEGSTTARMVRVTPGITEGDRVSIVEPPLSGRVVTLGQQLLADGSPVRVVEPLAPRPPAAQQDGQGAAP